MNINFNILIIKNCLFNENQFLIRFISYQYDNLKKVLWASFQDLFFSSFMGLIF